jgi:hypothetical protein
VRLLWRAAIFVCPSFLPAGSLPRPWPRTGLRFEATASWLAGQDTQALQSSHGYFQLYGAKAFITPDGTIHLARGRWKAKIT